MLDLPHPAQDDCLHVPRYNEDITASTFVDKLGESKQGHITLSAPPGTFSSLSPSVLCMPHAVPFSPKMLSVPAAYLAVTIGPATAGPARDTVRQFMCSRPSPRRHRR